MYRWQCKQRKGYSKDAGCLLTPHRVRLSVWFHTSAFLSVQSSSIALAFDRTGDAHKTVLLFLFCIFPSFCCCLHQSLIEYSFLFLIYSSSIFIPFLHLVIYYSLSLSPLSLCASLPPSLRASLPPSLCACLCLSACLPVRLSLPPLSVPVSVSVCLPVCLSLCFRNKSFLSFFRSLIHVFPSAAPRFACLLAVRAVLEFSYYSF